MDATKSALAAVAGFAAGAVTLRAIRPRRGSETATAEAVDEPETATEHAAAAVEHAGEAGELTLERLGEEIERLRPIDDSDRDPTRRSGRRLRRVGKGWIRR